MKLAQHGSLLDMTKETAGLHEELAKVYIRQIISGLQYVHKSGWIHGDIKLENILIDGDTIYLADWGFAKRWKPGHEHHISCGSKHYRSPELLRKERSCGPEVDVWSLGVTIYSICCGKFPFWQDVESNIQRIQYAMPPTFSLALQDLIRGILCPRKDRLSLDQIARHPWIKQPVKSFPTKADKSLVARLLAHVLEFIQYVSVLFVIRNNFFLTPYILVFFIVYM